MIPCEIHPFKLHRQHAGCRRVRTGSRAAASAGGRKGCAETELQHEHLLAYCNAEASTPFASLSEIMRLAAAVAYCEDHKIFADWIHDSNFQRMCLDDGRVVSIDDFGRVYRQSLHAAQVALHQSVLHGLSAHSLPDLDTVLDKAGCTDVGYSFLQDLRNHGLHEKHTALLDHLARSPDAGLLFADATAATIANRSAFNVPAWTRWLDRVWQFVRLLIALVHLTSGQPARAPELASILVANMKRGARGVHATQGRIMLVTRYWKGRNVYGRDRPVARFLPNELSRLLLAYLVLVRPIELVALDVISKPCSIPAEEWCLFMREGRCVKAREVRDTFMQAWKLYAGYELTFAEYRHVAYAFATRHIAEALSACDQAGDAEETGALAAVNRQAGRSRTTGVSNYGLMASNPRVLDHEARWLFRDLSTKWHALLGIHGGGKALAPVGTVQPSANAPPTQVATVLGGVTGPGISIVNVVVHNTAATAGLPPPPRTASITARHLKALRQLLGSSDAGFQTAEQAEAIAYVEAQKGDALVILPTGGGKSLCFMLPAYMEQMAKTTVVIVPTVALCRELRERAEHLGLQCLHWEQGVRADVIGNVHLIFAAIESAVSDGFDGALRELVRQGRLARFVFDECHLALLWPHFRTDFYR